MLPLITQEKMDDAVEICLSVCEAKGWKRGKSSAAGRIGGGNTSELENPTDPDLLDAVMSHVGNDDLPFDDWVRIGLAIHSVFGYEDGWPTWSTFSQRSRKYDEKETAFRWNSFEPDGSLTFGTLVHEARRGGELPDVFEASITANRLFTKAIGAGMPVDAPAIPNLPDLPVSKARATRTAPSPMQGVSVRADLGDYARKEDGKLHNNSLNIYLHLMSDDRWLNAFGFDLLRGEAVVKVHYPSDLENGPYPRPLADTDYSNVFMWFQQNWFAKVTKTDVVEAVDRMAHANSEDPIRVYLEFLPDTIPMGLLDNWLFKYMGVERTGDPMADSYTRAVGRCWLIGAVARAMEPACQMDNALVLEGPQGIGKSSALRALMPDPEWFGDALPEFNTKEASEYINGKWVIELAELTSVLRSEVEDMRRFMTQRTDEYRPAYGRKKIYRPRRCVLAGSTNRDDYLKDAQGERRIWPVECGRNIDVLGIARDRDILWKEAYDAYMRGESWYLDPILASYATQEQKDRVEVDPLMEKVAEIVGDMDEVSPRYVFDMLGLAPDKWNAKKGSMRTMLVLLGYERPKEKNRFKTGRFRDQQRYVKKMGANLKGK